MVAEGEHGPTKLRVVVWEKWVPPFIAGIMAGIIAVGSNLWLEPAQKRSLAVFDDKREAAKDLSLSFTRYLTSYDIYREHMLTMEEINRTDQEQVSTFRSQAKKLFMEFNLQTRELSYALTSTKIYFDLPVRNAVDDFHDWHNMIDQRMRTSDSASWPPTKQFAVWREKIVIAIREEIIRSA